MESFFQSFMMSKSTITVISFSTSVLRCLPPLLCIFIYTHIYVVKKQTATSFCFVLQSIRETSSVCFHFLLKGIICLPWQRFVHLTDKINIEETEIPCFSHNTRRQEKKKNKECGTKPTLVQTNRIQPRKPETESDLFNSGYKAFSWIQWDRSLVSLVRLTGPGTGLKRW